MGTKSSGFALLRSLMEKGPGEIFSFEVDAGEGPAYVNRIRVELSGLRKLMKGMGKNPKRFKVIVVSMKTKKLEGGGEDPTKHIVELMRTDGQVVVAEGMREMIALMEQEGRSV